MPRKREPSLLRQRAVWLGMLCVVVLGYVNYMHNYAYPAQFFWDENYHIASAQKYLNGVFFMEPHPPLGKLLIAAGEKLLHPNERTDQFIGTDYANGRPMDFSFAGYRFFPALLAWWTAPVLFGVFLLLSRNALQATLLSFLYLFDTALIVHLRGAMLEGPLLFFCCLALLGFLLLLRWKDAPRRVPWAAALFGVAWGCAVATKLFALLLVIPALAVVWAMRDNLPRLLRTAVIAAVCFGAVYLGSWQAHFLIATHVNTHLPDNGYYQASPAYQEVLDNGWSGSIGSFPLALRDHLHFVSHYEQGVPELNFCKSDENGSPFFLWPIGSRAINYRWETARGGAGYQYLYLQANPAVWFAVLLAVLVAASLLLSSVTQDIRKPTTDRLLLGTFLAMYVGFFAAISRIDRVLYLYHYFLPLLLGFCLVPLCLNGIQRIGMWPMTDRLRTGILLGLATLTVAGFQFYKPLAYYEPLQDDAFQQRAVLDIWGLHCARCQPPPFFAQPSTTEHE